MEIHTPWTILQGGENVINLIAEAGLNYAIVPGEISFHSMSL